MRYTPTKHYEKRFRKRLANSKRIAEFANMAYDYGESIESIDDPYIIQDLISRINYDPSSIEYRLYNRYLHIFNSKTHRAITVYYYNATPHSKKRSTEPLH